LSAAKLPYCSQARISPTLSSRVYTPEAPRGKFSPNADRITPPRNPSREFAPSRPNPRRSR
jgi:hypothetical protein